MTLGVRQTLERPQQRLELVGFPIRAPTRERIAGTPHPLAPFFKGQTGTSPSPQTHFERKQEPPDAAGRKNGTRCLVPSLYLP